MQGAYGRKVDGNGMARQQAPQTLTTEAQYSVITTYLSSDNSAIITSVGSALVVIAEL